MDNVIIMMVAGFLFLLVVIALPVHRYVRPRHATRKIRPTVNSVYANNYFDKDQEPKNLDPPEVADTLLTPPLLDDSMEVTKNLDESPKQILGRTDKAELIIVLYVIAEDRRGFVGTDILTILEESGLKYGEMKIFHHYGVGELKVKRAIFSVANLTEPGIFHLHQLERFTTRGLAFFMRLPGPFGGRVAFELMLNTTHRVAEILKGHVEDERYQALIPDTVNILRERIAHFEQR